jgi:hypothetical protein
VRRFGSLVPQKLSRLLILSGDRRVFHQSLLQFGKLCPVWIPACAGMTLVRE